LSGVSGVGNITDVPGIKVGVVTDTDAVTGCTVITVEKGAIGGVSVMGGAPGTRETDILSPLCRVQKIHGIALSGGSAFGLGVACGVMRYLEEKGFGLKVGAYRVPIVPGAIIFDLFLGNGKIRPDASWGYQAASSAFSGSVPEGSVGAGTGATVAKCLGLPRAIKAGQATLSSVLPGGAIVGVLVVLNAFGDILDKQGNLLAGPRDPHSKGMLKTAEIFKEGELFWGDQHAQNNHSFNTTLAVLATNARLSKAEVNKVASVAHNGLARSIAPLHTGWDGDTVFAIATGEVNAPVDLIGLMGAELLAEAVRRSLLKARSLGGVPALRDLGTS
jgi:L-aminopeptidase/D-esterase-like protein